MIRNGIVIKFSFYSSVLCKREEEKIERTIRKNKIFSNNTCTLLSGRLILLAASSLMNTSGYFVLAKRASRISSWALVKVVRSRRCFLGGPSKVTIKEKTNSQFFLISQVINELFTNISKNEQLGLVPVFSKSLFIT